MQLTTCGYCEYLPNNMWKLIFDVKNVSAEHIKEAERWDEIDFNPYCFAMEVYLNATTETIIEADLIYIHLDGTALYLNSTLTDAQKEYVIDYYRKEIKSC